MATARNVILKPLAVGYLTDQQSIYKLFCGDYDVTSGPVNRDFLNCIPITSDLGMF
jgi:hypothetical protein